MRVSGGGVAGNHVRERNAADGPEREDLGTVLDEAGYELCSGVGGKVLTDDSQRISGIDLELVSGEKARIAEMDIDDASRGLKSEMCAERGSLRGWRKGLHSAEKSDFAFYVVSSQVQVRWRRAFLLRRN